MGLLHSIIIFTKENGKEYLELENETLFSDIMFRRDGIYLKKIVISHKLYEVLKKNLRVFIYDLEKKYLKKITSKKQTKKSLMNTKEN